MVSLLKVKVEVEDGGDSDSQMKERCGEDMGWNILYVLADDRFQEIRPHTGDTSMDASR